MPDDRLPKKRLFGEVKGLRPPGRPRSSFNDVTLRDCQNCRISRPYRDAQDRLLWRDKTCPAHTYLIMSWKAVPLLLLLYTELNVNHFTSPSIVYYSGECLRWLLPSYQHMKVSLLYFAYLAKAS